MKDWYELYVNDINNKGGIEKYFSKKIVNRKKLLNKIKNYTDAGKIIEAGCGSGVLSIALCKDGYDVIAIDNNKKILKLVKDINKSITSKKVNVLYADIFEIDKVLNNENIDVIFSVGVFEHFSNVEIIALLKRQLKISKYVFLAIPTKYFNDDEALYGNERFLNYKTWRRFINQSGGIIIEEFSCQNDNLWGRIKKVRKYFRPAPIHTFVIKRRD